MLDLLIILIANELLGHLALAEFIRNFNIVHTTSSRSIKNFIPIYTNNTGMVLYYTTDFPQVVSWHHLPRPNYKTHYKTSQNTGKKQPKM